MRIDQSLQDIVSEGLHSFAIINNKVHWMNPYGYEYILSKDFTEKYQITYEALNGS